MTELTVAEAAEVAGFLCRVVPRGADEAQRLELLIRHLSRRLVRHDPDDHRAGVSN